MDVKKIIKKNGYTIESVANQMGITRITLTQNLSRNPTVGTLQKIANVIGCKVGDFFADEMSVNDSDLIALIRYKGHMYQAETIEDLKRIVNRLQKGEESE